MTPLQGGGEMIAVTMDNVTYADARQKFEAGTPPIAQAVGSGHAIAYQRMVLRKSLNTAKIQITPKESYRKLMAYLFCGSSS